MTWPAWMTVVRAWLGTSPWRQWFLLCSAFTVAAIVHVLLFGALQKHYAIRLEANQHQMIDAVVEVSRNVVQGNNQLLHWSQAINELGVATRGLQDKEHDLDGEAASLKARQAELDKKMKDVREVLQKFMSGMHATHPAEKKH